MYADGIIVGKLVVVRGSTGGWIGVEAETGVGATTASPAVLVR